MRRSAPTLQVSLVFALLASGMPVGASAEPVAYTEVSWTIVRPTGSPSSGDELAIGDTLRLDIWRSDQAPPAYCNVMIAAVDGMVFMGSTVVPDDVMPTHCSFETVIPDPGVVLDDFHFPKVIRVDVTAQLDGYIDAVLDPALLGMPWQGTESPHGLVFRYVAGGTRQPFASEPPVLSWDPRDWSSGSTYEPFAFGKPWRLPLPDWVSTCDSLEFSLWSFALTVTSPAECPHLFELTIPNLLPRGVPFDGGPGSLTHLYYSGPSGFLSQVRWITWGSLPQDADPDHPFASNVPAVWPVDTNVARFVTASDATTWAPTFHYSGTTGSESSGYRCDMYFQGGSGPMASAPVDPETGDCSFVESFGHVSPGKITSLYFVMVLGQGIGIPPSFASALHAVEPASPPVVDQLVASERADATDLDLTVDASSNSGSATLISTLAAETPAASAVMSDNTLSGPRARLSPTTSTSVNTGATVCSGSSVSPNLVKDGMGGDLPPAHASCAQLPDGSYRLSARKFDGTGKQVTTLARIAVSHGTAQVTETTSILQVPLSIATAGRGEGTVTTTTGQFCPPVCGGLIDLGANLTLTAIPAPDSTLARWTGCDQTSGVTCTVTMGSHRRVVAVFAPPPTLSLQKSGTGLGSVTSGDGRIGCGATCEASYGAGTEVTLRATAGAESTFRGWTGCDLSSGTACTVAVTRDHTVVADFALLPLLSLQKEGSGSGSVSSGDDRIVCGVTCALRYAFGSTVTLTAVPDPGSAFMGWTGCDTTSGTSCWVAMPGDRQVIATFAPLQTLTVTRSGLGSGSVSSGDGRLTCGASCAAGYAPGSNVTLYATPANDSTFAGWTNCDIPTSLYCTVLVTSAKSVSATFALRPPPSVANFVPTSGGAGTALTLSGSDFVPGATTCRIGSIAAPCTATSSTTLVLGVPSGATSAKIYVATGGGERSSGSSFTVGAKAAKPTVASFDPLTGAAGTPVTINGTNVGAATSVKVGTLSVSDATRWTVLSATSIRIPVPVGTASGTIAVSIPGGGTATSTTSFTIQVSPRITSFSPTAGTIGTTVTIAGTGLSGVSSVRFGSADTSAFTGTSTSITVTVPAGASTGVIRVVNAADSSTSTQQFSVVPFAQPLSLSTGYVHTCAALSDGTARCWGSNSNGQLGDGTTVNRPLPTRVGSLTSVRTIAAGDSFTCASLSDGTARCWGSNANGQLGNGGTTQTTIPATVLSAARAKTALGGVAAVAAGASHACALITDGTVKCWGANASGQLGNGTTTQSTTPVLVSGLTSAVAIDAGGDSTCVVLASGSIACWGANADGQLGNNSTTAAVTPVTVTGIATATRVSVALAHACASLTDGTARCWGAGGAGRLGDGTTISRLTPVVVNASGSTGLANVIAVATGDYHSCAITSSGVVCWGNNLSGQLGTGMTGSSEPYPKAATGGVMSGAKLIACGGLHTVAVLGDGVRSWGGNANGQLGDGTTVMRTTAVRAAGF